MGYDNIACVREGDTTVIFDGKVHSQTSAPGYAMLYVWAIRHFEDNPWTSFEFDPEHKWLLDPANEPKIWPFPK